MIPGIKCVRTNVLPANSSGNYSWSASSNNRITFQIPQFPNSYVNTKRSFIRFLLKTSSNGVLVPQANVFRRMLLKSSRGQVLEDMGDKGVAVLPQFLRFYLFSEGPHGARLPCFWSQSLVRSVHLRNPKGTICEVKFCPRGSQNRKKQVKFCEAGGVPTRRPSDTRQKFTPVRRPHAGFTEGRPTPAR